MAAEGVLDGTFLFVDLAADGVELGGGVVVESAVGEDFVAEGAEEGGEVLNAFGEGGYGGPVGAHGGGRLTGDFAPLGGAIGDEHYIADIGGFESGSGD